MDLRARLEDCLAHRVERLLQAQTVVRREGVEQGLERGVVVRFAVVAPARGHLGGEHAVGRLLQRRVLVPREPVKLAVRRLEHHESVDPGHEARLVTGDRDGDALLSSGLCERVVVQPRPRRLDDLHPRPRDRAAEEVPREPRRERLGRPDRELLGEGVDGVLLRVRGQHGGVVALQVHRFELAREGHRDRQVPEFVPLAVAIDPHQVGLRLAVLVDPEACHGGIIPHSVQRNWPCRIMESTPGEPYEPQWPRTERIRSSNGIAGRGRSAGDTRMAGGAGRRCRQRRSTARAVPARTRRRSRPADRRGTRARGDDAVSEHDSAAAGARSSGR